MPLFQPQKHQDAASSLRQLGQPFVAVKLAKGWILRPPAKESNYPKKITKKSQGKPTCSSKKLSKTWENHKKNAKKSRTTFPTNKKKPWHGSKAFQPQHLMSHHAGQTKSLRLTHGAIKLQQRSLLFQHASVQVFVVQKKCCNLVCGKNVCGQIWKHCRTHYLNCQKTQVNRHFDLGPFSNGFLCFFACRKTQPNKNQTSCGFRFNVAPISDTSGEPADESPCACSRRLCSPTP